jgi:hypothetical protein
MTVGKVPKRCFTYVLRSAESDASNAIDFVQVQLLQSLASLLLIARVDHSGRATGNAGVAALLLGLIAALLLLDGGLLGLVVGELLDTGVRHLDS